jgi:peptidoglycan LD-endopeptidase LytH
MTFLIGCVFGASAILIWVEETKASGTTRETRTAPVAAASVLPTRASAVIVPVSGVTPDRLKPMFNEKRGARVHEALDILAPRGTTVVAAVDGTIRKLFTSRAGGLTIYQFDDSETNVYYYAHLDGYAPNVREGVHVKQGDVIGYVGTTGNAPPGTPHLHFSISKLTPTKEWWKGTAVDPYPILTAR